MSGLKNYATLKWQYDTSLRSPKHFAPDAIQNSARNCDDDNFNSHAYRDF